MKILAVALMFSAFGIVGSMDYEDAKQQEAHYCEMVEAGNWPAYNESINCEGK